ncbi:MAG: FxSxx-COOH system tetratricopeptide repeat protein [Chloroflexota bacterium]|nr:FxSxx-COOH system tetratricopeptide repeat protein [Chloroflexota bacterium]
MGTTNKVKPNALLRRERLLRGWTQADVAGQIGTDGYTVNRWECGRAKPGPYFRQKLCILFAKNAEELGFLDTSDQEQLPPATLSPASWMIPYRRNAYFTARDEVITSLFQAFHKEHSIIQVQAICGLGGLGKTHTAIEYAYRYRTHYQAIYWLQADSPTTLLSQIVKLAEDLGLGEKYEQDFHSAVAAVRRWFEAHDNWLLILDNLEDLHLLHSYVPLMHQGYVLYTTRLQATGTLANCVEIEKMHPDEGALCLLRRAKILAPDASLEQASEADRLHARELSLLMDGLPLGLDQAGAYIEEVGCGVQGYLQRYQRHRATLLGRRGSATDHLDPVATTWSLSFTQTQQASQTAADILHLCAFLEPETIAEEILSAVASEDGACSRLEESGADLLWLDDSIGVLRNFSLVQRSPENRTLNIHRLIQAVLRDGMDDQTRRQWATKAVCAVQRVFPIVSFSNWQQCQRYLPQALACADLIAQWHIVTLEAAGLLHQTGHYLHERAHYTEAEPLYEQARAIYEQLLGTEHPGIAPILESQASLYEALWKDEQAEPLYQQALAIHTHAPGPESVDLAESITKVAFFYYKKGQYEQAEPLCQQAVAIFERLLGPEHIKVAESLSNLAVLYQERGFLARAEPLHQRALAIREQAFGAAHPDVATILKRLGGLYHEQGHYIKAASFYTRALRIREQVLGPDHPQVAASLRNLAMLYQNQGKYDRVRPLYQRALAIRKQAFGTQHPLVADILNALAEFYLAQGQDDRARHYFMQARAMWEQTVGPEHPDLAHSLHGLAELACKQGQYEQAGGLCERILTIRTQTFGEEHHEIARSFTLMALLAQAQERYEQAETLYTRALVILEKSGLSQHPRMATTLYGLARLHQATGNDEQGLAPARHALAIQEQVLGRRHPETVETLALLAELTHMQEDQCL